MVRELGLKVELNSWSNLTTYGAKDVWSLPIAKFTLSMFSGSIIHQLQTLLHLPVALHRLSHGRCVSARLRCCWSMQDRPRNRQYVIRLRLGNRVLFLLWSPTRMGVVS